MISFVPDQPGVMYFVTGCLYSHGFFSPFGFLSLVSDPFAVITAVRMAAAFSVIAISARRVHSSPFYVSFVFFVRFY